MVFISKFVYAMLFMALFFEQQILAQESEDAVVNITEIKNDQGFRCK